MYTDHLSNVWNSTFEVSEDNCSTINLLRRNFGHLRASKKAPTKLSNMHLINSGKTELCHRADYNVVIRYQRLKGNSFESVCSKKQFVKTFKLILKESLFISVTGYSA